MGKEFTVAEVAKHTTSKSLWIILHDNVYDVTEFKKEHPGGAAVMEDNAGRDATVLFENAEHTEDARALRDTLIVGTVKREAQNPSLATKADETFQPSVSGSYEDWDWSTIVSFVLAIGLAISAYSIYTSNA